MIKNVTMTGISFLLMESSREGQRQKIHYTVTLTIVAESLSLSGATGRGLLMTVALHAVLWRDVGCDSHRANNADIHM